MNLHKAEAAHDAAPVEQAAAIINSPHQLPTILELLREPVILSAASASTPEASDGGGDMDSMPYPRESEWIHKGDCPCGICKSERRRRLAIRQQLRERCPAELEGVADRIDLYRELVTAEESLFDEAPR
jgi:hypothetical protein